MKTLANFFSAKTVDAMKDKFAKRGKGIRKPPPKTVRGKIQGWTAWAISVTVEEQLMVVLGSTLYDDWHRLWR